MSRRLLVVAEAVTLAHLARPLVFAEAAAVKGWSVTLACDQRFARFFGSFQGTVRPISSIEPGQFLTALRRGSPLYSPSTLDAYVREDLEVLEDESPTLVVGDFRLSLSVSARVAGVPYATISNAYWSPGYQPPNWPVPQLPLTRFAPIPLAQALFGVVRPLAFRQHTRPLNDVRRRFGLASLGTDLRRIYTDADFVLYADLPELFPVSEQDCSSRFLGPVLWEPRMSLPGWWGSPLASESAIYVTLGSSGDASLLPAVVKSTAGLGRPVLVATAGAAFRSAIPADVYVAEYLPGLQTARRAAVVICNGGNLTAYQALAAGTPVVGIASNLDQFLNMQAIERAGAGLTVRADRLSPARLRNTVVEVLESTRMKDAARQTALFCAARRFADEAGRFLDSMPGLSNGSAS